VLGGWQGRQIQIQPQPGIAEAVAQGVAFAAKECHTARSQLLHLLVAKAIEGARQGRLIGELGPSPSPRQRRIGTQAGIDLRDGATAGQDADQDIEQLTCGRVIDRFEGQVNGSEEWPEKVGAGQTVTQDSQRGKVGLVWHDHHADNGAHHLPPDLVLAAGSILPHAAQMLVGVCYPRNFAQNWSYREARQFDRTAASHS